MTNAQIKLKEFKDSLNAHRIDLCYDISKYLVEKRSYNTALYTLLILNKIVKKEPLKYLPYIHKLIAKLLNYKYPFLSFYQEIQQEHWVNNKFQEPYSFISLHINANDNLEEFISHESWVYFNSFKRELDFYRKGKLTENSWREPRWDFEESNNVIYLDKILTKKLKLYTWNSKINFGDNTGKTIKEIFNSDPKIIFNYHNNLNHFTISTNVLLSIEFFNALEFGDKYWIMFEKNVIKLFVKGRQDNLISEINELKRQQNEKHKREYRDFLSEFNGDDDESRIMRGLMNGNGDQFGY